MKKKTQAEKQRARVSARWAAVVAVATVLTAGAVYLKVRGPSGMATTLGGDVAAVQVPELPADAAHWIGGAPLQLAASRGQVVLIDGWHPT